MTRRANVNQILRVMEWNKPRRVECGANGYILKFAVKDNPNKKRFADCLTYYKNYDNYKRAMEIVSREITEKTGIVCKVTSGGNLQVPYAIH